MKQNKSLMVIIFSCHMPRVLSTGSLNFIIEI